MSVPPESVELRRERLRRRCAEQRAQLGEMAAGVTARLQPLDRGLLALRRLRLHPTLLAVAAAAVSALPMFRYIGRALLMVRAIRGLLPSR